MKAVLQRVRSASVEIHGEMVASIDTGALVLLGVARGDTTEDAAYLAKKTAQLRVYDDADGKLSASIDAVGGSFLVVSQFTLYADCRKGNRPGYAEAAGPEDGERLYEEYVKLLRGYGYPVETGRFRAEMMVKLENDGPVTIIMESRGRTS